jgi:hypothetical protein
MRRVKLEGAVPPRALRGPTATHLVGLRDPLRLSAGGAVPDVPTSDALCRDPGAPARLLPRARAASPGFRPTIRHPAPPGPRHRTTR